jgi:cytochrome b6-f complex iron-sulfur subunit
VHRPDHLPTIARRTVVLAGAAFTSSIVLAACGASRKRTAAQPSAALSTAGATSAALATDSATSSAPAAAADSVAPASSRPVAAATQPSTPHPAVAPPATSAARASNAAPAAAPASPAPPAGALAPLSAVPVGGSRIVTSAGKPVVLSQASAGKVTGFSAICTHMGCTVNAGGSKLNCPCHGSVFNAFTGAVVQGPATRSLPAVAVHVSDGYVVSG